MNGFEVCYYTLMNGFKFFFAERNSFQSQTIIANATVTHSHIPKINTNQFCSGIVIPINEPDHLFYTGNEFFFSWV